MEIRVEQAAARLDAFLASVLTELSRSRIQSLIRDQFITVDDSPAKPRDPVKPGQLIRVMLPEAVPDEPRPEMIPLVVLHEDDDLIVVDKAAGMVVHPAPGNPHGTLVNALLHHCGGCLSSLGERAGRASCIDSTRTRPVVSSRPRPIARMNHWWPSSPAAAPWKNIIWR